MLKIGISGSKAVANKLSEGLMLGSDFNILIEDPGTTFSLIILLII